MTPLVSSNFSFNNISVISWRSVLLVEETGVPGENHLNVASHRQTPNFRSSNCQIPNGSLNTKFNQNDPKKGSSALLITNTSEVREQHFPRYYILETLLSIPHKELFANLSLLLKIISICFR